MKFISDQPEATREFLPPGTEWSLARPFELSKADRGVWRAFGHGDRIWLCDAHVNAGFTSPNPGVTLIAQAPESQFVAAVRALQEGETLPDALFCLALEGANFRGQRSRSWDALHGNLHLTAVYRADFPAGDVGAGLTMLPAVAAVETVRAVTEGQVRASIKWVNDVLVDGRKIAGVLTSTQIMGDRIVGVVFGVGLNIEQAPRIEPTPFVPAATAVSDHVPVLSSGLPRAFWDIVVRIDRYYRQLLDQGPLAVFGAYREYADVVGRRVRIWPDHTTDWRADKPMVSGVVTELHPDLSLALDAAEEPVGRGRLAYEASCRKLGL